MGGFGAMGRFFSTRAITKRSARHPGLIVIMWVMFVGAGVVSARGLGDVLTSDSHFTKKPESIKPADLIDTRFTAPTGTDETIVVQSGRYTSADPEFKAVVEKTTSDLRARSRPWSTITILAPPLGRSWSPATATRRSCR
jgi:hypothetical protein